MPDYPILQQNKPIGTLTVTQAGLFTVFSARAKASGLEHPAEEYEICIAYRNDGHNALVHTGRRVEVAQ